MIHLLPRLARLLLISICCLVACKCRRFGLALVMPAQAPGRPGPASHSRSEGSMKRCELIFSRDLTGVLHVGPDCETDNPYFPSYYFPGNGAVVGSGQIPIAANNNNNNNNAAGGEGIMSSSIHSLMACSVILSIRNT